MFFTRSKSADARFDDADLDTRYYTGPNIVEDGSISADNELIHAHSSELYTNKTLTYLEDMVDADEPWFMYLSYQVGAAFVRRCYRVGCAKSA